MQTISEFLAAQIEIAFTYKLEVPFPETTEFVALVTPAKCLWCS